MVDIGDGYREGKCYVIEVYTRDGERQKGGLVFGECIRYHLRYFMSVVERFKRPSCIWEKELY